MKHLLKNMAFVTILIYTLNITALAVQTTSKLQLQKESLSTIQTESEGIERKIEQFDNEIGLNIVKTEENKAKITQIEKEIKSQGEEINKVENDAQKQQDLFNSRMRAMYINGYDGYTSVLLNSNGIGDFISRVENIKTIIEFDNKVMDKFKKVQNQLNEKQKSLNYVKGVLINLQVENKQKLDNIILAKESQKQLITDLEGNEDLASPQTNNSEVLMNNSIVKSTHKYTASRGSVSLSQNSILEYASCFIGTPYLWGGTSPSTGFDCSGFTQYVYSHFGISVGRSTTDQINDGVQVSKSNLRPGDLVFFGSNNNPQHTGIYAGNNNYIHSPRTGDVVRVSPMIRGDYITARRVK